MAIISIADTKDGQSVAWSGQQGRVYANSLVVVTDDAAMGPRAVLAALGLRNGDFYRFPLAGTAAEWDYGSFIQSLSCKKAAEDGKQWLVEVQYGPFDWQTQGGAVAEAAAVGMFDPMRVPPQVSWSSAKYERAVLKDARGTPIQNTAGDPFDPPLKVDDSRPVLSIVRNESRFDPLYAGLFKDTINGGTFLGYDPHTVKCADITAKREYHADYGYFWEVLYTFELRPVRRDSNGELIDAGWVELVLNAGLRQKSADGSKVEQILVQEAPVSSPVLLAESGRSFIASGVTPTPHYLRFQLYPERDFDVFNFPEDLLTVGSLPGQGGIP